MSNRRPGAPRSARRPVSVSGARRPTTRTTGRPAAKGAPGSRNRGPAAASRPRSTAPRGPEEDGPGVVITRRTLALVALVVIALAALVPTVNSYVAQRQQLSELRAQVQRQEEEVEDLRTQVDRWEDPAYVAARARERLLFAMPGETQYRLTDTSGRDVPLTEAEQAAEKAREGEWFSTLWESVEGSSRVTAEDIPDEPGSTDEDAADEPPEDPDQ
ncbi:septum formation initiator family protein [Brachybacterium sp. GCM10030268]|uniref:FtsB family cell division protein n=1 Tax=Brachybacterium sp. GCM10030268 TaxID=3273382 RepID=UPI00361B3AC2